MESIPARADPAACTGAWRHLRAAPVSLVAVALAVGGHLYGGGAAPSIVSFLAVWALAALTCWHLSRRRWTVRTLAGALVLVQAALHILCSVDGAGATEGMHPAGGAMIVGHAVATAGSIAVLRYGESTVWALLDALLLVPVTWAIALVRAAPSLPAPPVVVWAEARSVAARIFVGNDPLRAPPVPA